MSSLLVASTPLAWTPGASGFGWLDWLVIAVYVSGTTWIAVRVRDRVRDMADFVVAGRAVGTSLGVATLIGSELGLVTVMYAAQKGFTGGFAALHIGLVAGLVTLWVGRTGFLVEPLRELGVMTIPEFYERRFDRRVRVLGGAILALAGILNMGLFLKAGALFVAHATGWSSDLGLKVAMSALLILVLGYVSLGGMVAVVVTDYIQFVVLSFGLLIAAALAVHRLGWDAIVETVRTVHGASGFDPIHADGFGWSYVVWMMFTAGLVSCAIWQTAVARACSLESPSEVRRLYTLSSLGFAVRFMLPNLLGLCALTWALATPGAAEHFLPGGSPGDSETTLAAMPAFLGAVLPMGLLGLVVAGMISAFMSTHDSYLLCWASVLTQDVVAPLRGERLSTRARMRLTRILIFAIGLFLLVWSLWYPLEQDLWDYMAVTGAVYFTGAFAVLWLGLSWRRASSVGALAALGTGFLALLGLEPVRRLLGLADRTSLLGLPLRAETVGLATVTLCVVALVAGSLVFPDRPERGAVAGRWTP